MIPQRLPVFLFVQYADTVLLMLGRDIQCDLGQVQVRADSRGGRNMAATFKFPHYELHKRDGIHAVQFQILRHINERFIDGVNMNILRGEIFQVQRIDI